MESAFFLAPAQVERYSRHILLPEIGADGQSTLLRKGVLVVGAGGLGSPLALYLAAAGVGRIGLVDPDTVSLSNLQRQVLFGTADLGRLKVEAARERLLALNPDIEVETYPLALDPENARTLAGRYDLVADGSDRFDVRYLASDASLAEGRPLVHGSIYGFEGQVTLFEPPGPCYRCLYPEPPPAGLVPACSEAGVLGVLPAVVGSIMATEAIKRLLGIGRSLKGRLLLYNALDMSLEEVAFDRDPRCRACGDGDGPRPLGLEGGEGAVCAPTR